MRTTSVSIRGTDFSNATGHRLWLTSFITIIAALSMVVSFCPNAAALTGTRSTTGTFTEGSSFNGMQITYTFSGAILDPPVDASDFTTTRSYRGNMSVGTTMTLTGTVHMDWGSISTSTRAWVEVDGRSEQWWSNKSTTSSPTVWEDSFNVDIPIPSNARTGAFGVSMYSSYGNGESRGLVVSGSLTVPPVKISYVTLSQEQNEVVAGSSDSFKLTAVVFAEGQSAVPDGTRVNFTMRDWSGDLSGAELSVNEFGLTSDSRVVVTFYPPDSDYWDSHDASAGISNRITVTAECYDKEASVNIVITEGDTGDDDSGGIDDDYDSGGDDSGDSDEDSGDEDDGSACGLIFVPPLVCCAYVGIQVKRPRGKK